MPLFAAIGDCQFNNAIEERIKSNVGMVKSEAAQLVERLLTGDKSFRFKGDPVQRFDPSVVGRKGQQMVRKLLQRGGGAEIPRVAVVLFRFGAPPESDAAQRFGDGAVRLGIHESVLASGGPNWSAVGSAQQNQLSVRRGGGWRRKRGLGGAGAGVSAE